MEAAGAFSVFGCMQMQEMWLVVEYNVPYVGERKGSPAPPPKETASACARVYRRAFLL